MDFNHVFIGWGAIGFKAIYVVQGLHVVVIR